MSPSMLELHNQLELYRQRGAKPPLPPELFKAACLHAFGRVSITEIAAPLAVMFVYAEARGGFAGWALRAYLTLCIWNYRRVNRKTTDRPLWNDYEMCRWMLDKRPYYAEELVQHLERSHNVQVVSTGIWMTNRVSEQDPEFRAQWHSVNGADRALTHFKVMTAALNPSLPRPAGYMLLCDSCGRQFADSDFDLAREVIPIAIAGLAPEWTESIAMWEMIATHAGWLTHAEPQTEPHAMRAYCPQCPETPSGETHA